MFADFGVVTTKELGLVFRDYELPAPKIQVNTLKVEGRDGSIDLSEAIGKIAYQNREVVLYLHDHRDLKTRQKVRRELERHIHGKYRSLYISDAPNHEIKGRWSVEAEETGSITKYEVVGDCYPFRSLGKKVYRVNAAGGIEIVLVGGDKLTRPIIEVQRNSVVEHEGVFYILEKGAYYVEDMFLPPGTNVIYINTLRSGGHVTWNDLAAEGLSWNDLATKRLTKWQWGNEPPQVPKTWNMLAAEGLSWSDLAMKPLVEYRQPIKEGDEKYAAYIEYERQDF